MLKRFDTLLILFKSVAILIYKFSPMTIMDRSACCPPMSMSKSFSTSRQVKSEIQNPILAEMAGVIQRKRGIICESVLSEFKQLVSMCGGPNEKLRADKILKCLM